MVVRYFRRFFREEVAGKPLITGWKNDDKRRADLLIGFYVNESLVQFYDLVCQRQSKSKALLCIGRSRPVEGLKNIFQFIR